MGMAKKRISTEAWLRRDNQRRERERYAQQQRMNARQKGYHPWGTLVTSILGPYGYDIDRLIEGRPFKR